MTWSDVTISRALQAIILKHSSMLCMVHLHAFEFLQKLIGLGSCNVSSKDGKAESILLFSIGGEEHKDFMAFNCKYLGSASRCGIFWITEGFGQGVSDPCLPSFFSLLVKGTKKTKG